MLHCLQHSLESCSILLHAIGYELLKNLDMQAADLDLHQGIARVKAKSWRLCAKA